MTTIALDAMGGDSAPRTEVEGAVAAARELGVRVALVGQPDKLKAELARHQQRGLQIEIVPASEVISMHDSPTVALRKKRDSSVHVAARLVKPGGRLLIVDFAPHSHEELRTQDAHARLGFSDEQIAQWYAAAGLELAEVRELVGHELTVKLWLGRRPEGVSLRVVTA